MKLSTGKQGMAKSGSVCLAIGECHRQISSNSDCTALCYQAARSRSPSRRKHKRTGVPSAHHRPEKIMTVRLVRTSAAVLETPCFPDKRTVKASSSKFPKTCSNDSKDVLTSLYKQLSFCQIVNRETCSALAQHLTHRTTSRSRELSNEYAPERYGQPMTANSTQTSCQQLGTFELPFPYAKYLKR